MTRDLDVVGIGSMVVDRMHRAARLLGGDEKGMLQAFESGASVENRVGGVVLNHLGWAAALGLRTGIFGRQPKDEGGRFLQRAMARAGIEAHLVEEGAASSSAEIFVDDEGARTIYMAPAATAGTSSAHVRAEHASFIARARFVTTEVSQLPLAAALEAMAIAKEEGCRTVVDLDVPPSDALRSLGDERTLDALLCSADILKPSKRAGAELAPEAGGEALALASALRARFGNEAVAVTDGAAGCAISTTDFEGFVAATRVKVIDTTGAGDAFLGGLLAALVRDMSWPDAARLANACGAACAEQVGAFPEAPAAARARITALYGAALELPPMRSAPQASNESADAPAPPDTESPGLTVLGTAARELHALALRSSASSLGRAAELAERCLRAGGSLHVTGVGKPEHLARYGASLLSSTGAPSFFLHATEALHGSLGQLRAGDVLVAISNSGQTPELVATARAAKEFGARIIALTGDGSSPLARLAECVLDAAVSAEGGPLGLAPRASAAAELIVLAAFGAELQQRMGFSEADYAKRHPGGELGARARGEKASMPGDDDR